ncbi:MAG TPA: hypothetical protein PLT82_01410 [Candidatus Hydrogenedens sp.]|nr:hypothetical protein [Candidatus Hydrogenedens sp.]HOL19050.1 hypothetical protein [Candidatus Hydrogenedens sp.]HPP57768.1 hypothetical protein [Candidatus Hydrogenedens sp.]
MEQILAILEAKRNILKHQILSIRKESKLKISVITFSAIAIWLGIFFGLYEGFDWLLKFGSRAGIEVNFGELLMARMFMILMSAVFLFLIFSNILIAFFTLYKAEEIHFLVQTPIPFNRLFFVRFIECIAFSSWSVAFLGVPLILAYGLSTKATIFFYIASIIFFAPFVIIPAGLGNIITQFLVLIFPKLKLRFMILFGVLGVIFLFWYINTMLRGTKISEDTILPVFLSATSHVQSPLFPPYWFTEGVLKSKERQFFDVIFWFMLMIANALFITLVASFLSRLIFYPGFSGLQGMGNKRIKLPNRGILGRLEKILRIIPEPYQPLVVKDIRLFWRDATQWSQFIIFFGIMAIYIANLRNTTKYFEQEMWRSFIACMNIASLSLILATLTSRFIFPLISLEGHRFWVIGLAPITLKQLVWQKFWLSVMTSAPFTVTLAILSGYMLQLTPLYFTLTVFSIILMNLGLSGLAVGLGALYPSFEEDNPARIVSGLGGTLNLLLSIFYIALVVTAQTVILQWNVLAQFTRPEDFYIALTSVIIFIVLLTIVAVFLPMTLGLRNLKTLEY